MSPDLLFRALPDDGCRIRFLETYDRESSIISNWQENNCFLKRHKKLIITIFQMLVKSKFYTEDDNPRFFLIELYGHHRQLVLFTFLFHIHSHAFASYYSRTRMHARRSAQIFFFFFLELLISTVSSWPVKSFVSVSHFWKLRAIANNRGDERL